MTADPIALAERTHLATIPATAEVIDRFRAALAARDIVPPENIIADGSIHRCDAAGKNGKGDAAYLLHLNGIPAGGLENWRDGRGWESWITFHPKMANNGLCSMLKLYGHMPK